MDSRPTPGDATAGVVVSPGGTIPREPEVATGRSVTPERLSRFWARIDRSWFPVAA
jgi:hypothetical protein